MSAVTLMILAAVKVAMLVVFGRQRVAAELVWIKRVMNFSCSRLMVFFREIIAHRFAKVTSSEHSILIHSE